MKKIGTFALNLLGGLIGIAIGLYGVVLVLAIGVAIACFFISFFTKGM